MRTGIVAAVVASFIAAGCAAPRALDAGRVGALERAFTADIQNKRIPGAVLLLARDGKVAYAKALGVQDPVTGAPMRVDSIFRIYSMTKPVVSAAAMQLVEEGRLRLDDPVSNYLPEMRHLTVGTERNGKLDVAPAKREITVRDLLRHTSGITYGVFGKGMVKDLYKENRIGDPAIPNAEFVLRLAKLPLMYEPGTRWEYGHSTDVLGALVERVSGRTLDVVLAERIFKPLKMVDTGFWVPLEKLDRVSEPFDRDPDGGATARPLQVRYRPAFLAGGHGLVSTAPDYLRFAQMLANGGELDGARILKSESVAQMTRDQLGPVKGPSPAYGFGLGFAVRLTDEGSTTPGRTGEYNWGGLGGTAFWVDPKEGLIAILMLNAQNQRAHYRILYRKHVYGALAD